MRPRPEVGWIVTAVRGIDYEWYLIEDEIDSIPPRWCGLRVHLKNLDRCYALRDIKAHPPEETSRAESKRESKDAGLHTDPPLS